MGKITSVSYAELGLVLSIRTSGDVPTNFASPEIVIVHPDARAGGWLKAGEVGISLEGKGVDISKIKLPYETVQIIKGIYEKYIGKDCRVYFNSGYKGEKDQSGVGEYAVPGLYNDTIAESKK